MKNITNNMAQTAVEWFYKNLIVYMNGDGDFESAQQIYEQAKAMEKQQMIDFAAQVSYGIGVSKDDMKKVAEQYYNEKYNK